MSNLESALSQASLMMPASMQHISNPNKPRTRFQVAKRVFQLAASGGFPYTGMTYKQWGKKWLSSDTFRLMEIDINAAASPHLPKNPERVAFRLLCSVDSVDPIVVDVNRQKVGNSHLGYIPSVIVVDGKHRKQGQMLQGRTRILAWVGCRAQKKIKNATVIDELKFVQVKPLAAGRTVLAEATPLSYVRGQKERPLESAINLHCAVSPAGGAVILDQSGGEGGSRPKNATVEAKKDKLKSSGAGGMGGSLGGGSGSNPLTMRGKGKVVDECDACGPALSEGAFKSEKEYQTTPNIKAPGAKAWSGMISADPKKNSPSPGSGVGPRLHRSTGATRSEMSRLADTVPVKASNVKAKSKVIDKVWTKDKSKRHLFAKRSK